MTDPNDLLPLPAASFHILISLGDQDRHGYAILRDVSERTGGAFARGPATLYTNIKRLLSNELIEESGERPIVDDERRRYYRLTPFGRQVAAAELHRLQSTVRQAKALFARS